MSTVQTTTAKNKQKPSRSAISRLEIELKQLQKQLENLQALNVYKPHEFRQQDYQALFDVRALIEAKQITLLQLKLLL
jgi:PIN domain nuclease of toxin-antitoxin system